LLFGVKFWVIKDKIKVSVTNVEINIRGKKILNLSPGYYNRIEYSVKRIKRFLKPKLGAGPITILTSQGWRNLQI